MFLSVHSMYTVQKSEGDVMMTVLVDCSTVAGFKWLYSMCDLFLVLWMSLKEYALLW